MYTTNKTQIVVENLKHTNNIVEKWCQIIYFNFGCHSCLAKFTTAGSANQAAGQAQHTSRIRSFF